MNAARIRSKCLKNTFSKGGRKHASRELLTQINTEAVADLIAATGTNGKHAPFNSGGLLSPRIPGLTVPPAPPSCFRSVRQRDTVPAESLPEFLLANCSVLFRGCMSAQADTVSVIITTCSHAPFRSHHLGDIKQPAQEAGLIAQEARLSGPGFQSIIAACARIAAASFLLLPHRNRAGKDPSRKFSPAPTRILQAEEIMGISNLILIPWTGLELSDQCVVW